MESKKRQSWWLAAGLVAAASMIISSGLAQREAEAQSYYQYELASSSSINIDRDGNAVLRGTVQSRGSGGFWGNLFYYGNYGNTLTVRTWGGIWTVRASSNYTYSNIQNGDAVEVTGTASPQNMVINATSVVNLTDSGGNSYAPFKGQVASVSPWTNSFVMASSTASTTSYTVYPAMNAILLSSNGSRMSFGNIRVGDSMEVTGILNGSIIIASLVRDISR